MSGILGLDVNENCWEEVKSASGIQQPRGDEWGGFAVIQGDRIERQAAKGKITSLLREEELKIKDPRKVITHVNQSPENPQPAKIKKSRMGQIALAFDGKIINEEELMAKEPYLIGSEAGIMARLVGSCNDPLKGLQNVFQNIKGPFSLVVLTMDGIFAARDVLGIRPMVSGRFLNGNNKIGCGVASESTCLEHIGMELIRDIKPGEIVAIAPDGFKTIHQFSGVKPVICSFEYGYWSRISSVIESIWVHDVRTKAGMKLVPNCPDVDIIASFPMSGNAAAEGFHQASGVKYQTVFDYNLEAGGRSFLPFDSETRTLRAKDKLLIISPSVKGKKIVMVDDSIVEGRQILSRIFSIKKAGAKEIHLRIETPQIKYPCPFGITPRGKLLASDHTVEEMRKKIGADTLAFNTVEDLAEAIISSQSEKRKAENPIKAENICFGCSTGEFPKYPNF